MKNNFFKGKKIAITAHHLEQSEHRGLASVDKSLIKILYKYGAEIYLITGYDLKNLVKKNIKKDYKNPTSYIEISDIKKIFEKGRNDRELFESSIKYKIKLFFELINNLFLLFTNKFEFKYTLINIKSNKYSVEKLNSRLEYLKEIKGFICIKNIFHICRVRSMRLILKEPKLNFNIKEIDLVISSSPLSLKYTNKGNAEIIQLIHDAIPFHLSTISENRKVYYNRLVDAHKYCRCFYTSKDSKKVVTGILNLKGNKSPNSIINPLPSLNIEILRKAYTLSNIKSIRQPFILFNSSIVEHKKVENTIHYFKNSDLPKRNFLLCLAGKLHKNEYCKFIKSICNENKHILLLDYVSDIEKAWLFLNSSLLISTSSNEGFGIPVLDALSINLYTLASAIPSHFEISSINKKNKLILIKQRLSSLMIQNLN